ncbi:MAG: prepilin-type N-terminal cleavage/methylation domain-containing protein [Pseudohongiellaceae bacterium]|jgi:prepilin-type N-terminal cleavage/methylation domain-containing protein
MKDSYKSMQKQGGFTLIEIAIVLVIIGLLVGGVLQGQELIENSRVKQAVKDLNGTAAAMFAYQDRYGTIPGDDGNTAAIATRGVSWGSANLGGDADGILESTTAQTFTGAGENDNFWRQLMAAGFLSGDPADQNLLALPNNPWGGRLGVTTALMGGGLAGTKVCMSQVPGSAAIAIDNQIDDGSGATGRVRATVGVSGANTPPTNTALGGGGNYSEDNIYSLCYRM